MKLLSWLVGILALCAIVIVFRPQGIDEALGSIGLYGLLGWLACTVAARLLVVETTVKPIVHLGYRLGRSDAFWLGWIRTFANQVVPLSGLALYLREVVRRSRIPWPEAASLATPQIFLALTAVSAVGIVSILYGHSLLNGLAPALGAFYALLLAVAMIAALRADWLAARLPRSLAIHGARISGSFKKLATDRSLLLSLVCLHLGAILIRGCRLWLLFALLGSDIEWRVVLLIVAIAESASILQLTPGGLGLREGAIVGAASLTGVNQAESVIVALVDRLFIFGLTVLLLLPAIAWLRRHRRP